MDALINFRASTSESWSKVAASSLARLAKSGAMKDAKPLWDISLHALRETSLLQAQHKKDFRTFIAESSSSSTAVKCGMVDQQQTWDQRHQTENTKEGRMVGQELNHATAMKVSIELTFALNRLIGPLFDRGHQSSQVRHSQWTASWITRRRRRRRGGRGQCWSRRKAR